MMALCRPNFLSVDHPFVTVKHCSRLDACKVAARIGLTKALAPTHFAAQNFRQELAFLFFCAPLQKRWPNKRVTKKIGTHRRASIGKFFCEHNAFEN